MNTSPSTRSSIPELPSSAGTYALLLACRNERTLQIGRRGALRVEPGCYVYVGSAFGPGGLRARIAHHLRIAGHPHWHLDYLRQATIPQTVWFGSAGRRQEHLWARLLAGSRGARIVMPGFGASDCNCPSHLFYFKGSPSFSGFCRRLRRAGAEFFPVRCLSLQPGSRDGARDSRGQPG